MLEVGAGTGRNIPYLLDAVGPQGTIIGVDASAGMLEEARKMVERHGWSGVRLVQQDAAKLELDRDVDAVLFSLSYSVLPEPQLALAHAWRRLRPSSRLAVMDMGLAEHKLRRLFDPIARLLAKLAPGDAYSRPWEDLATYGSVATERFLFGLYYVSTVEKTAEG